MVPDPALRAPATNHRRLTVVEREDNALAARCAMGARKQRSSGQTMEDSAPDKGFLVARRGELERGELLRCLAS